MRTRTLVMALAAVALLAVVVTVALAVERPAHGGGPTDLRYGAPFTWLVQDQSQLESLGPGPVAFGSPWENPSHIVWARAALSWAAWFAVGAVLVLAVVRRRRA